MDGGVPTGADFATLRADEVRVWGFALDAPLARLARAEECLSPDERLRANAFFQARDRDHFVAAHRALRFILGGCLRRAPADLRFVLGPFGKPRLAADFGGDLQFNLSHAHGRALAAVARGCEVGVDLEPFRADVDCAGIVDSHFSPAERAAWAALPEPARREAFFHGWARKEAYVKARGDGLSHPPDAYTVDLDPQGPGALLADSTAPGAPAEWTLRAIEATDGFAAAVAYRGAVRTVRVFELG